MANLRFVEKRRTDNGPYEVTQLVNSFLAALAHPWEEYKRELNEMTLDFAISNGWPKLAKERREDKDPDSLGRLIWLVRNSFAHGNIVFLSRQSNEITHLQFWNNDMKGRRTWGTTASVGDLRLFLDRFAELAEELTEINMKRAPERRST
jgi:hypothetical protein